MIKKICISSACATAILLYAQTSSAQVWSEISKVESSITHLKNADNQIEPTQTMSWARKTKTELSGLQYILNQAPHENTGTSNVQIALPLPDGDIANFTVSYSPILSQDLAAKLPDAQTYKITDIANPQNSGRLDLTSRGFHAMFTYDGERVFIDPANSKSEFYSYYHSDYKVKEGANDFDGEACTAEHHHEDSFSTSGKHNRPYVDNNQKISIGQNIRQYRMAVAATGEYTQYFGGTEADGLAAIVTAVNRLNAIFEPELAVRLELVGDNEKVVYTDPDTDPFTQNDHSMLLDEVEGVLDTEIGNNNYDIGHVFTVSGGGLATLGGVCRNWKARGVSGTSRPERSSFVTLLAHEVGHQFNAPHSFNGSTSNCSGNRSSRGAVEPHSGSTIMSYAGLCGSENLNGGKDTFFHNSSLTFMNDYVESLSGAARCAVLVGNNNTAPEVDAGPDSIIPALTPFTLDGTVNDSDGDTLTHIWEQVDVGPENEDSSDFEDDGQRTLFRSFQPIESPSRTFPQLERVLANDFVMGEVYPSTDRDLTFRLTSRDNKGGVTDDERIVQVVASAGPFNMITPASSSLDGGVTHSFNWDVANTDAAPINCNLVDLLLSTNSGQDFDYILATETENDGVAAVELPNLDTNAARLKVSCSSQPFFAINDANFTIQQTVVVNAPPVANDDSASVEEDSRRIQIDVLANDTDPEGDQLLLASVSTPDSEGTSEISNGLILYTPNPGFVGTERFSYTVGDGNDNTATGTVTVTVTEKPNVVPDAADDSATVDENSTANLISVLDNDRDADGDVLTITSLGVPDNGGSVSISGSEVSYTPATDTNGSESFTYVVSDGEGGESTATVNVTITAAPIATTPAAPPSTGGSVPVATAAPSGGGGSFGLFMLFLLALRKRLRPPKAV